MKSDSSQYIGQTFGELTVINTYVENHRTYCDCQCSCGNIKKHILLFNLRNGATKTCGNPNFHPHGTAFKDLTGQRFGKLVVIEKMPYKSSNQKTLWKCVCDCGEITIVRADYLLNGHTQSCGCLNSKGEEKIAKILKENNIVFERQKTFESCVFPDTGYLARFDFWVNNQYIIEYDGIQHFKEGSFYTKSSQYTKQHDLIKNQWCKENNIPLIRIPYTEYGIMTLNDLLLESSKYIYDMKEEEERNYV